MRQQGVPLHLAEADAAPVLPSSRRMAPISMAIWLWLKKKVNGTLVTGKHGPKPVVCPSGLTLSHTRRGDFPRVQCRSFHRLVGEAVGLAAGPHLGLVHDQVPQALVVHHADENVRLDLTAMDAWPVIGPARASK